MDNKILNIFFQYNPWWESWVPKESIKPFHRSAFNTVNNLLESGKYRRFYVLSGMRRTGKTTILFQLIDNLLKKELDPRQILYLSLDHPVLQNFSLGEIIDIYQKNIYFEDDFYLFLDEIHCSENWDLWLKTIYDMYPNVKLVATGSASLALLKGKWESGAGRIREIRIPTLSFYEYCCLKNFNLNLDPSIRLNLNSLENPTVLTDLKFQSEKLEKYFNSYLFKGGFPEFVTKESKDINDLQERVRNDIVENVLKKDLPNYYEIRNSKTIGRIFYYFCNTSSDIISIEAITKELSTTSRDTVQKFIDYLESACLINRNNPIFLNGKKVLKARPKVYLSDTTILNAMLSERIEIISPELIGKEVETAVFNSLFSYFKSSNIQFGYLRGGNQKEVDVIIKRPHKPELCFEVKYRNNPSIKKSDLINDLSGNEITFVITKQSNDFGIRTLSSGKKAVFIPAPLFLYLIGWAEYNGIDIFDQ